MNNEVESRASSDSTYSHGRTDDEGERTEVFRTRVDQFDVRVALHEREHLVSRGIGR